MAAAIGVICATQSEVKPFLDVLDEKTVSKKALLEIHEGELAGVPVVVTCCGICKANAAMAAQILIDVYGVKAVVNAGTAGGMDPKIDLFDIAVGSSFAHHDVDSQMMLVDSYPFYPSGVFGAAPALLEAARVVSEDFERPVHFGAMVSGEQFVDDAQRDDIVDRHDPLSVDMESAAMAQVCFANEVPFVSVRGITDTAAHDGFGNYEVNRDQASKDACAFTVRLLEAYSA